MLKITNRMISESVSSTSMHAVKRVLS